MIQLYKYIYLGFPLGSVVKELPCNEGDLGSISGLGTYAQRKMMSFSSILAWRISWTDEPSRLQSIGSQRVGHIESTSLVHKGNILPSSTLVREERGQIFVGVEILKKTEKTQRNQRGIRREI